MLRILRALSRLASSLFEDGVSADCLRHHQRHELSRGVDLPTWRTPREVSRMRRAESRQARGLRVVGR